MSKRRAKNKSFVSLLRNAGKRRLTIIADYRYADGGGITDRLNGIIALYRYCVKNGFHFRILHTAPFLLERFLEPGPLAEDWRMAEPLPLADMSDSLYLSLPSVRKRHLMYKVLDSVCSLPGLSILYVNSMIGVDIDDFSRGFRELFQPTDLLEKYILKRLSGIEEYQTVSFRFCQLLGDYKDVVTKPLPKAEREVYMGTCLNKLIEIEKATSYPIVITSDSLSFLRYVSNTHNDRFLILTEGTIHNVGMVLDMSDEEVLRLMSDYLIISRAKKAWQVKAGQMYRSRFPEYAAGINHIPYELVELDV